MNRREGKGNPSRDLMVCFPTRAHLRLMPKPLSSSPRRLQYQQNHLRKSIRGGGHASPYLRSGPIKQMSHSDNLSEPTSPKVTCAGQIKVRPTTRSCKNWQTVMEEIERLHDNRKKKSKIMQFLTCLRRIKFDFHCLGGFSHVDITSDDEDEDDQDDDSNDKRINQDQRQDIDHHEDYDHEKESKTVFSKWFMVLQENKDCGVFEKEEKGLKSEETEDLPCLPPANALFLMRCRSAPAKSWMEEKQEEEEEEEEEQEEQNDVNDDDDKKIEKTENKRKSLMELMKNENDFYKLSCDIAKETWVIGGINKDLFSRSRSWKR
ncbi:hypothetical protein LXL04_035803 [Taraxacum kok-saghyz]